MLLLDGMGSSKNGSSSGSSLKKALGVLFELLRSLLLSLSRFFLFLFSTILLPAPAPCFGVKIHSLKRLQRFLSV